MGFFSAVWSFAITSLSWIWTNLFVVWIGLFLAPFTSGQFDMLWITVPVILNWAFTELYQEKKGTSLGNAISNGVVILWVGIDWARTSVRNALDIDSFSYIFYVKLTIAVLMFAYGLFVIISGIKIKGLTKHIGRVRQATYVCLVFTPIFYDIIVPDWKVFVSIVIFYPVFHYAVEFIDYVVPDPKTYDDEEKGIAEKLAQKQLGGPYPLDSSSQPSAQNPYPQSQPTATQQSPAYQGQYYPQQNPYQQQYPQNQQNQYQQYPGQATQAYNQSQRYQKPPNY